MAHVGDELEFRVHGFVAGSLANGPGRRAVLWLQGCTLGCPGCYNPTAQPVSGGQRQTVAAVFEHIVTQTVAIEGVTFSGGEPLLQPRPLLTLLRRLRRETELSLLLFTGYEWHEVMAMPEARKLLECLDVVLAGRYVAGQRLAQGLRGSANKAIHLLTDRYTPADLDTVPSAEVIIAEDGQVAVTGIDPLLWAPSN